MRIVIMVIVTVVFFTGCTSTPTNDELKLECQKQGKVFKLRKKFVYRTGEYETVGYCD